MHRIGGGFHAPLDFRGVDVLDAQAEGDVFEHRHVREQRQILEHHAEPALAGLGMGDDAVADDDVAAGRLDETGNHVERRRLAATRRPDQDQELAVADLQIDALDGGEAAEFLDQAPEFDTCHASVPFPAPRRQRRIMPKLKPFTRCFWMRMPMITTGMVITVPIAACGP